MNNIFTLTLNSAIEEIVFAREYSSGKLSGVHGTEKYYTGKAVNTGLVLSNLHMPCQMIIACGEQEEPKYNGFQNSYRNMKIFAVPGKTRVNQTIVLDSGEEYKIITKGYSLSEDVLTKIYEYMLEHMKSGDLLVIAGSVPDGVGITWYKMVIESLKKKGVLVFFDAAGDILREGLKGQPFYIKPNREEVVDLIGGAFSENIAGEIKAISHKYQVENVIVTMDKQGAWGYNQTEDKMVRAYLAKPFTGNVMTTGCGDSFTAGFIYGYLGGGDFAECMKWGVAFGGANISCGFPEKIDSKTIHSLVENCKLEVCE